MPINSGFAGYVGFISGSLRGLISASVWLPTVPHVPGVMARSHSGSRYCPATTRANGEPAGATRLSESGADMGAYGAGALKWIVLALRVKVPAVVVTSLPKSFTNTSGEVLAVPVDL